ncbi:MAG TPA: biliverdin-producing heme oxygenase [Puia sp.]|nr:biliverdin-producing heme oxygenase [Puia sp.]
MLSSDLKRHTENIHRQAEKIMVSWLKRIRSLEDYVAFLNWLYAYYSPLEDRIRTQLTPDNFPDLERRCRADMLLQDMEAAGIPLPHPEICRDLPAIDTYGKALGALYVLEGSTLGGRIIADMMTRQLDSGKCLSYFNSYGNETAGMWQSFKDLLDTPTTLAFKDDILLSARATFLTFKTWIAKHELTPELRF